MFKQIDRYIIKKFLGTYFLSIVLIISIAIVIDITEKMDNFYSEGLSLETVVMDYYIYFIPYYINLFSSIFTFISVIFVTSRLAFNSEIIAMLAGGISLARILRPYMFSAAIIAGFTFIIGSELIPPSIRERLLFETKYIDHKKFETAPRHLQMRISPDEIIYIERFNIKDSRGIRFSLDRFEEKRLVSRLTANSIKWDSSYVWTASNYLKRNFSGLKESFEAGDSTTLDLHIGPKDLIHTKNHQEQLTNSELRAYIVQQTKRGQGGLNAYILEYQKRYALSFASFILTLIGVSVACRKSRGGTGFHILIGFSLSITYILATLISSTLTINGGVDPIIAIWSPNVIYLLIGLLLYSRAPK